MNAKRGLTAPFSLFFPVLDRRSLPLFKVKLIPGAVSGQLLFTFFFGLLVRSAILLHELLILDDQSPLTRQ